MFDIEKVKKFRSETVEEYEDRTIIGEAVSKELFEPTKQDLSFYQTGIRTSLPKRFFTEGHATFALSTDFARSVFISERNHILTGLKKGTRTAQVQTTKISKFMPSKFRSAIEEVRTPTDVFIPTAFSDSLHSWIGNDTFDFDVNDTYIETKKGRVRIRWVPDKHEFKNIFVVDSDNVSIVQKQEKNADNVDFIDEIEECKLNSPDDLVMTYFGEIQDDPEEFDFFIRTVVSDPIIGGDSACMIDTDGLDVDYDQSKD
jgi:hypothetical protein